MSVSNDVKQLLKLKHERFFGLSSREEPVDLVSHVQVERRRFLVRVVDELCRL